MLSLPKQVSNERTHGLVCPFEGNTLKSASMHTERHSFFFWFPSLFVFCFYRWFWVTSTRYKWAQDYIFPVCMKWCYFFFHSVLLVCSPSLPIFRKDLSPNITNDKKILRDILNIWKKNYFQFCYWLWRSTLKLLQGLFICMEERIKINDDFLKNFDDKFIGKCEYGNGHHLCLSKQWRQ